MTVRLAENTRLKPHHLTAAIATAIIAFVVHTTALVVHELLSAAEWPRWLELVYLLSLMVWVPALAVTLWAKATLRRNAPDIVLEDERSDALLARAHMIALVFVLLLQVPFIVAIEVPAKALGLMTVTTCLVTLFASYAWLDR